MRKKPKKIIWVGLVTGLFGVLMGVRALHLKQIPVVPSDYEGLKFSALEYVVEFNHWDKADVDSPSGKSEPRSISLFNDAPDTPENRRISNKLKKRFPQVIISRTGEFPGQKSKNMIFITDCNLALDGKKEPVVKVDYTYWDGSFCYGGLPIVFKRSFISSALRPEIKDGFISVSCQ